MGVVKRVVSLTTHVIRAEKTAFAVNKVCMFDLPFNTLYMYFYKSISKHYMKSYGLQNITKTCKW